MESHAIEMPKTKQSSWSQSSLDLGGSHDKNSILISEHSGRELQAYHPTPKTMAVMWNQYVNHVDILFKIVYKPQVDKLISCAVANAGSIDPASHCLLLGIWLASAFTMSPQECLDLHGKPKSVSVQHYRHGLEDALSQARWMTTQEMMVLQAIILYLVCGLIQTVLFHKADDLVFLSR